MTERAWQWVELMGQWALAWTVIVLMAVAWMRLGRPLRVTLRYWGWTCATFAGAALALMVLLPGPQVSWRDVVARIRPASAPLPEPPDRFVSWFDGLSAPLPQHVDDAPPPRDRPAPGPAVQSRSQVPVTGTSARLEGSSDRWLSIALAVWAGGFLTFAARLAWAASRVRALTAASTASSPVELQAELESTRRALGLRRSVRLVVHPEIDAPLCVGLFRPAILWPTEANCPMTPSQRQASLTQELAHLLHFDDCVGLLAEAWRSLSWFYLPVHWTLGRMRLERESRCDEIAARHLESPEFYARWLLDLAPIKIRPPVLASSLLGGADLTTRVRRLLDGEPRPASPLSKRQMWMFASLTVALLAAAGSIRLVGFAAHAAGTVQAEPADAPLPEITAGALAEKIAASQKRYATGLLVVEFEEERARQAPVAGAAPEGTIKFPGRFQYASDGRRWRVEFDSMMTSSGWRSLISDRWASGFDGERHYTWKSRPNEVIIGESEISATTLTPRELFWHRGNDLIEMLGKPGVKVGQRTVDGVRCYVVEQTTIKAEVRWRTEYLISPRQSYLAVGLAYERRERRYFAHRLLDLRETDRGLWVPGRMTTGAVPNQEGALSAYDMRRSMRVVRYEPSRVFAEGEFRLQVPVNADVTDLTLGTGYCNDPWWPEIGKLLRDRFDWPKVDVSRLSELATYGTPEIIGRPAPPMEASLWINSGPLEWRKLRGKVVLVDFTALGVRQNLIPGLRKLVEFYGPAGLEVVSVFAPRDSPDDVRQFVRELRISYPVAIDRPHDGEYGETRRSFGMKNEVSTFLVDREGIVHPVTREMLIEDLVRLLRGANAGVVEPLSLKTAEFSNEMTQAVQQSWQVWVNGAMSAGSIVGTITDARARPVAGANVRVTLQSRVRTHSHSHFLFGSKTHQTTTSGPDGNFIVVGLCKGNYALRVAAPGFAVVDRETTITDVLGPASILVVLGQSDTITGQVVDESGKPVAGAETILSERKLKHADGTETHFNGFLEGKVTDGDGRFRFGGLSEGSFILRVKGDGFAEEKREDVPAGSSDLKLVLGRPGRR